MNSRDESLKIARWGSRVRNDSGRASRMLIATAGMAVSILEAFHRWTLGLFS